MRRKQHTQTHHTTNKTKTKKDEKKTKTNAQMIANPHTELLFLKRLYIAVPLRLTWEDLFRFLECLILIIICFILCDITLQFQLRL